MVKIKNIFRLSRLGPAVGIHRLSVPSGADAKTHAAQGGEGAGGDTPPG